MTKVSPGFACIVGLRSVRLTSKHARLAQPTLAPGRRHRARATARPPPRDALPNASYLGFTGAPIESTDRSTRAVFGEYIDVYDLTRAVENGATVGICYEPR
jgi:type I site-specific restriction-modification system R (restriction) subunit